MTAHHVPRASIRQVEQRESGERHYIAEAIRSCNYKHGRCLHRVRGGVEATSGMLAGVPRPSGDALEIPCYGGTTGWPKIYGGKIYGDEIERFLLKNGGIVNMVLKKRKGEMAR